MSGQSLSPRPRGCRPDTEAFHRQAVERAVSAMHRRFGEEGLGLEAIAAEAISSPFHFARYFRDISRVPPCHFLTAVRMHRAKQLLSETRLSVTNVCLEVGFNSLGTFTRRFTELVGLPPRAFRRGAHAAVPAQRVTPFERAAESGGRGTVTGHITAPVAGCIAVGLFPTAIPQGLPVACCLVDGPGPYQITGVPAGRYFVLAAALATSGRLSSEPEYRGSSPGPVEFHDSAPEVRVDLELRVRDIVDPPILLALPSLLSHEPRTRGHAAGGV